MVKLLQFHEISGSLFLLRQWSEDGVWTTPDPPFSIDESQSQWVFTVHLSLRIFSSINSVMNFLQRWVQNHYGSQILILFRFYHYIYSQITIIFFWFLDFRTLIDLLTHQLRQEDPVLFRLYLHFIAEAKKGPRNSIRIFSINFSYELSSTVGQIKLQGNYFKTERNDKVLKSVKIWLSQ